MPRVPGLPIARLATELRATGLAQAVIGVGGLVAALAVGASPGRALVPFAVAFAVVSAVSAYASRWMREARTPAAGDAPVEPSSQTLRRCGVGMAVALVAVVAAVAFGEALGAVLGGVVAAAGAVDLRNLAWVRARERASGEAVFRELGSSPFSGGRRPLYTRPTNDSTLAT
jgi:hypothetical protein